MGWFREERRKNQVASGRKTTGFNDLLSYLMLVDEKTVLHKDGALSQHFVYQAPDLDSSTEHELLAHSQTWQKALSMLGDGWMVETNVITSQYHSEPQSKNFPDIVSAIIDDERSLQFQSGAYFKSCYYLSITWKPADVVSSKARKFILSNQVKGKGFEQHLDEFNAKVNEFVGLLSRSNRIESLKSNELISMLNRCITGINHDLVAPYQGAFLDAYLSHQDFMGGFSLKMGNQFVKVLAIDDLPSHSYPCILDLLTTFPVEYRWSSRFIPLDSLTAGKYLKRYERSWSTKAMGFMGVIRESMGMPAKLDADAEQTAEMIRAAKIENSSGNLNYGFYNSTIILMNPSQEVLDEVSENIIKAIQQLHFKVRCEFVNATEAYLGSIPCHGDYNLRKMLVDAQFVSHALPMSQVYQGESKAPCPFYQNEHGDAPALLLTGTKGSRPFLLNCHVGDVGHTAILGPTGNGKSTLIAVLLAAHRQYEGSRVIVLDKDKSHKTTIQALGGSYMDLSKSADPLSPLVRISPGDAAELAKAAQWLTECCEIQGVVMTPERQSLLREALERLSVQSDAYKNLSHISIQDSELREAIATYAEGPYSKLLNGTASLSANCGVIGLDMTSLISTTSQKQDLRLPVIRAVFNELEALFVDKRPTLLVLEEAWGYLKHPLFFAKLTDWFKTLRKANVSVLFVSQDLSDIADSKAASIIQNSCMTRIYLPNSSALEPAVKHFYQQFGLNDRQIDIIQSATPKQDYYYNSVLGNRLFSLDLGELAKSFLCISSKQDVDAFSGIYSKESHQWVLDWLRYKGETDWCEYVEKNYQETLTC